MLRSPLPCPPPLRGRGGPPPSPLSAERVGASSPAQRGRIEEGASYRFLPFFWASPVIGTKRTGRTVSLWKLPSRWRV
jgi:hypothetical protein